MVPINQVLFFVLQPELGTLLANSCCVGAATVVNWFVNDPLGLQDPNPKYISFNQWGDKCQCLTNE